MHICTLCQREFTTKGSLHRHQQNHQRTREYACSVCKLSFLRHDLLTRHARIHEDERSGSNAGRLRSRKACEACRRARTKCDGSLPCTRCRTRSEECSYSYSSANTHTSRDAGVMAPSPPVTAGSSLPAFAMGSGGDENSASSDGDIFGIDASVPALPVISSSLSPLATSWLWLHEDTFLQSAVSLDFFDIANGQFEAPENVVLGSEIATNDQILGNNADPVPTRDSDRMEKSKRDIVDSVVDCASRWTKGQKSSAQNASFEVDLKALCPPIATDFELITGENCISTFIALYEEHFWPLWPLVSRFQLDFHTFHPFLYLAIASIGAMYGGKNAASFGMMLHARLREELIQPLFDHDIAEKDMLSLGQARSLTQAAALYFGHERAFTFAQHIGANLVAQARRTNLFSTSTPMNIDTSTSMKWVDSWIRRENRKRLAFAILRLEMYTSVLHSTRPLVSAEELDIELPCSRYVWHGHFDSIQLLAAAVKQELSTCKSAPLMSDLIRIAFDPSESLPYLGSLDQELVFNSMQERVWTACSAIDSIERLTSLDVYNSIIGFDQNAFIKNTPNDGVPTEPRRSKGPSIDSHLASRSRKMNSLRSTVSSVLNTLHKCHASLTSTPFSDSPPDRTSLLSCLLTFHLSHLQIFAPLPILHKSCHLRLFSRPSHASHPAPATDNTNASSTTVDHDDNTLLSTLEPWTTTYSARVARSHAAYIYHLLRSEADRPPAKRASVNLLTTIGLYHSAVLLWVCERVAKTAHQTPGLEGDETDTMHHAQVGVNGEGLIDVHLQSGSLWILDTTVAEPPTEAFVTLFYDINPAWAVRSSFCAAVQRLVGLSPPLERHRVS